MIIPNEVDRRNPWHGNTGQEKLFGKTLAQGFEIMQCPAYVTKLASLVGVLNLPPEAAWHIAKRLNDRFGYWITYVKNTESVDLVRKPSDDLIDELEENECNARLVRAYAQLKRKTRKGERKDGHLYNLAEILFCLIGFVGTSHDMNNIGKDPKFYENGEGIVKAFERLLDNAIKKYSAGKSG